MCGRCTNKKYIFHHAIDLSRTLKPHSPGPKIEVEIGIISTLEAFNKFIKFGVREMDIFTPTIIDNPD